VSAFEDGYLQDVFAASVDRNDDSDWDEVVERAGLQDSSALRRLTANRRLLAAALLVVVLSAAAALAVGLRLGSALAAPSPGPHHVQRHVGNGTISWLFRHEPRGESLHAAGIPSWLASTADQPVAFARVVRPDPRSGIRVVVSLIGRHGRNVCMTVVVRAGSVGGCGIGHHLRPFSVDTANGLDITPGGGLLIAGLTSDEVARLELFLPHGRHEPVPLKDNVFAIRTPADATTANLVAYDHHGLVIGTSTQRGG
jgi:hypothetical protein